MKEETKLKVTMSVVEMTKICRRLTDLAASLNALARTKSERLDVANIDSLSLTAQKAALETHVFLNDALAIVEEE